MDVTIRYMLRPVAHCKEGCSSMSSDVSRKYLRKVGVPTERKRCRRSQMS